MIGIDWTAPIQTSNRLQIGVGSERRRDCFGSRVNESHSRRSVGGRLASNPSTSAQFLVRAVAAEPSRENEGEGNGYRERGPRRQGFVAGSRAFRAPLQRGRLAVGGQGRGEDKPKAIEPSSCAQNARSGHDRTRP